MTTETEQSPLLLDIARSLEASYPALVVGNLLFVPKRGFYNELQEICDICGVDEELFFTDDRWPNYYVCEGPGI